MFKKMLVCTDLSPDSDTLIHCVASFKSVGTQEIVLAHVILVPDTPGLEDVQLAEVELGLKRQEKMLEEEGIKVTVEVPFGVPARTLNETAEKHDVSAILVGSHGKGIVKSAALGSVSAELLHHSRRPVLLARMDLLTDGRGEAVCTMMFDKVLFPTDFSETAERALDYLGKIALEKKCQVTLLHIISGKEDDPDAARQAEQDAMYLLEAKQRRLRTLGATEVAIDLVHGKAAEEIVARTRSGEYTIAVMGGQGKGLLKEIFLGSTADEVARHAALPLLFIPAEG